MKKQQINQIGGIVRALAAAIGGSLMTFGVFNEAESASVVMLSGAVITAATGIWSVVNKRQAAVLSEPLISAKELPPRITFEDRSDGTTDIRLVTGVMTGEPTKAQHNALAVFNGLSVGIEDANREQS